MDILIRNSLMVMGYIIMMYILSRNIHVQTFLKGRQMKTTVWQQQEKVLSGCMQKSSSLEKGKLILENMPEKDVRSAFIVKVFFEVLVRFETFRLLWSWTAHLSYDLPVQILICWLFLWTFVSSKFAKMNHAIWTASWRCNNLTMAIKIIIIILQNISPDRKCSTNLLAKMYDINYQPSIVQLVFICSFPFWPRNQNPKKRMFFDLILHAIWTLKNEKLEQQFWPVLEKRFDVPFESTLF